MATREKFYFLAPTTEAPPNGPIFLGAIITHPKNADYPLNNRPAPIDVDKMPIYNDVIEGYSVEFEKRTTGMAGIFASFLTWILGISVGASGEKGNSNSETWICDKLETSWFNPTKEYIKESLENSAIKNFLAENPDWLGGSRVYMVTGLKIAYGATGTAEYAKNKGFKLNFKLDTASLGAPIKLGPEAGGTSDAKVVQELGEKTPFVLAFRMRRIEVSSAGRVNDQPVTGGVLGLGGDEGSSDVELIVDGIEERDTGADEFEIENGWDICDVTSASAELSECALAEDL